MTNQVRVNMANGMVTGTREHPAPAHEPATWYDEQRDAKPAFDPDTQVIEQDNKLVGDKYVFGFTVRNMTTQELTDLLASKWATVRAKRDDFLRNSDFTQLDDSPEDKLAWKTYRQELRDITNQTDPGNITWPTKPE
jgi:hypothetical protein